MDKKLLLMAKDVIVKNCENHILCTGCPFCDNENYECVFLDLVGSIPTEWPKGNEK